MNTNHFGNEFLGLSFHEHEDTPIHGDVLCDQIHDVV